MNESLAAPSSAAGGLRRRIGSIAPPTMLRYVLRIDAAVTGANGAAYLALAGLLDGPLGVEAGVLRPIGAFLLLFAAAVWATSAAPRIRPGAVESIALANAGWVLASLAILIAGTLSPTPGGGVWIVLQALVVGSFAAAQVWALRRL